jgi:hypothetical protein
MNKIHLCIIIVTVIFVFVVISSNNTEEGFTPYMRRIYRPYVRKARIVTENFYETNTNNVNILFRKFGIV